MHSLHPQNPNYLAWYEKNYPKLSGHGLWLRGGEPNRLPLAEYDRRPCRILISRLSTYQDTVESFTHTLLYQITRGIDGVFPDFAWLPPPNDGEMMANDSVPWLLGTQTKMGPAGFDVIALSNSIVQELVNVPVMLAKSSIPLKKSERLANPAIPLVLLGGANALHSTVLWTADPLVDGIYIGESTEGIRALIEICRNGKTDGLTKTELLDKLESVPGFIQPDKLRKTRRAIERTITANRLLAGAPRLYSEDRIAGAHLQISEGCGCFCSFCAEGWSRKPYREADPDELAGAALKIKAGAGASKLDLFSFNFGMHSGFYKLLGKLADIGPAIGLKSQRFDSIADDPALLQIMHAVGKSSITCGLEGISPRLRRFLHKSIDEVALRRALSYTLKAPIRELKIFLIATGLEEESDLAAFEDFLSFIYSEQSRSKSKPRVIFSLTPLVRFPHTPLEFDPAPLPSLLKPVIGRVKTLCHAKRFEFRLSNELSEYLFSQIMVRAHDNRIAKAFIEIINQAGFVYYDSVPASFVELFLTALDKEGLSLESLLKPPNTNAPWEVLDTGIKNSFLQDQYKKNLLFQDDGYCLGSVAAKGRCMQCDACDTAKERTAMTAQRKRPDYSVEQLGEKIKTGTSGERSMDFVVDIDEKVSGIPRTMVAAVFASALMKTDERLIPGYRGYRHSYWENAGSSWVSGQDLITLLWAGDAVDRVKKIVGNPNTLKKVNAAAAGWGRLVSVADEAPAKIVLTAQAEYPENSAAWCALHSLKYQKKKNGSGGFLLEFTAEAKKKKIVQELSSMTNEHGLTTVTMQVGEKFDPREFAKKAFILPEECDWVRVRLKSEFDAGRGQATFLRDFGRVLGGAPPPVGRAHA